MTDKKEKMRPCYCPYCDAEVSSADSTFCRACKVTIIYCPDCKKPVPHENRVCIYCGAEIKG